jgi:cytochrome c biogenesis protein CcmG/thiol:disulfide interchange protein DsbE
LSGHRGLDGPEPDGPEPETVPPDRPVEEAGGESAVGAQSVEEAGGQLPAAEGELAPPDSGPVASARAPRKLRSLLIGTTIAAALAVFLFVGLHAGGSNAQTGSTADAVVPIGSVAPDFTLPALTGGGHVRLDSLGSARHRPVVLNFFASWCGPCQVETPLLAKTAAAETAKGSSVQFVGVDVADKTADALAFVQKTGITYPIGVDMTARVASLVYGLNGQPQTFFIDGTGHVVGHVIGAVTAPVLQQWLHRLAGSAG